MSETVALWQCHYDALLLHPSEPRVLLLAGQDGWMLPFVDLAAPSGDTAFSQLLAAFERVLGMLPTVLHRAAAHWDEVTHQAVELLIMEQQPSSDGLPSGTQWVGLDDIRQFRFARPEQQDLIAAYLRGAEAGEAPVLRAPWARRGWYAHTVSWIEEQVTRLGYELYPPIVQVRTWCLSAVLRVATSAGDLYFKVAAVLPLFADEPAVMAALAALFPDHIPMPLAIDRDRRWMLLPDLGPSLREQQTVEARQAMLAQFVQLQRAAVTHVPHLLASGCLDRRLDRLAAALPPLLADADALRGLTAAEARHLRAQVPRLPAICAALHDYRVPETLVHGDLNLGNVALHGGKYQFFDWTDACVSHPFFDLVSVVWEEDAAVQAELLAGYLALWTDVEPLERLRTAWRLAAPLCCLHQAVSYQQIRANVEADARQEFSGDIAGWLRRMLAALAD